MSYLFYDHLINLRQIHEKLDGYDLSNTEKKELMKLIDTTIHHEVMNVILAHLPRELHKEFLEEFTKAPHEKKHLVYLEEKTPPDVSMETEITEVIISVLKEVGEE